MRVIWSERSRRDLRAIGRYIGSDNPVAARRWIERLRERVRAASRLPRSGRIVPETNHPEVREVFVGNYRIVYRLRGGAIEVLTVFEGHRRFDPP